MTTVLQYLVIAAVIGLVVFGLAVFVFGRGEQLAPLSSRTSPTELPDDGMSAEDVRKVRFAMALRGYRMSDVDWAIERMANELERLQAEVAVLSGGPGPPADAVLTDTQETGRGRHSSSGEPSPLVEPGRDFTGPAHTGPADARRVGWGRAAVTDPSTSGRRSDPGSPGGGSVLGEWGGKDPRRQNPGEHRS